MTDRDTFAAAALAGLLANEGEGPSLSNTCEYAYRIADAMLRERERYNAEAVVPERSKGDMAGCSPVESDASQLPCPRRGDTGLAAGSNPADSSHDAVPEAKARTDADRDRTDNAAARPGEGTGDIPCSRAREIAAYAVYVNGEYDSSYGADAIDEAFEIAAECSGEVVPLYRTPQSHATPGEGSVHDVCTLTDAEREAIADAIRRLWGFDCAVTLRGLLERMK